MWITSLDRASRRWPRPARWLYLALKWYLVALGAFALVRLWLDRIGIWSLY